MVLISSLMPTTNSAANTLPKVTFENIDPSKDTVASAALRYTRVVEESRSQNTHRTYSQAIRKFLWVLGRHGVQAQATPAADTSVDWVSWFVTELRAQEASTEAIYITALVGFYEYLVAEDLWPDKLAKVKSILKRRLRRVTPLPPPFAREQIDKIISYVRASQAAATTEPREQLRRLRDRAFVLTLADTGLRISEACRLTTGHFDWPERRAQVEIKGGRQSTVRFSDRAVAAIQAYLVLRDTVIVPTGMRRNALPIFARHDDGAGSKLLPLNSLGARKLVDRAVVDAVGPEAKGTVTPHSFRHYFVTVVLRASGGNLKMAQRLARHKNISITERYARVSDEEEDRGYHEIFNEQKPGKK